MKSKARICIFFTNALAGAFMVASCSSSKTKPPPGARPAAATQPKAGATGKPASTEATTEAKADPKPASDAKPAPAASEPGVPDAYTVQCNGRAVDLGHLLPALAKNISGVPYVRGKSDCSAMYHRLHLELEKKCPEYRAPPKVHSRQVALRFHEAGQLVQIKDALGSADLIKPGAVIFFGYRQNDYSKIKTEDLFVQGKGIVHVGVVVKVEKEDDKVVNYHLFHGRSTGKPSKVTTFHIGTERVKRGQRYPAFGNGRQPWVAFARMVN